MNDERHFEPNSDRETAAHRGHFPPSEQLVAISHQVPAGLKRYLQILAIEQNRQQRDLLAEALELLKWRYGPIECYIPVSCTSGEIEAFRLVHSENPTHGQITDIKEAADRVLELADQIRIEREA